MSAVGPSAMVLAAGRGARLQPLTDIRPKPLLDVGGQSLLERALEALEQAGVARVVVNVSWLGSQIIECVRARPTKMELHVQDEGTQRLETGGGICTALPWLGEQPFLVLNADVLTDYPLAGLLSRRTSLPAGVLAHLVLVPNPAHNQGGDFSLRDGRVDNAPELTFSGISLLRPELFAGCTPGTVFPLADCLRAAAARGQVSGECHGGYWNDVGTMDRLQAARSWAQAHRPAGRA